MRAVVLTAAALFAALPAAVQAQAASSVTAPLIERSKLFGNPSSSAGRVSPDGRWVSWIAPRDGVMNLWVAPRADLSKAKPLTDEKTRPIRAYFWSPDSASLLFVNDKGGDENFLLYGVDVTTGAQRNLTPFEKTRAGILNISRKVHDRSTEFQDSLWYADETRANALKELLRHTFILSFFQGGA